MFLKKCLCFAALFAAIAPVAVQAADGVPIGPFATR